MPAPRRTVSAERGHPVFAWLYARASPSAHDSPLAVLRADVVGRARGVTLDLGAGVGRNLAHLPRAVTQLHLVEPDPYMRARLLPRVPPAALVHAVGGEDMPLPDASVDTVLLTLTMCSVDEPAAVAREIRRVLRPDGQLLVLEHVLSEEPRTAAWQRRVDPVYTRLSGGCHLHRDTGRVLADAGFDTSGTERVEIPAPAVTREALAGVALPR